MECYLKEVQQKCTWPRGEMFVSAWKMVDENGKDIGDGVPFSEKDAAEMYATQNGYKVREMTPIDQLKQHQTRQHMTNPAFGRLVCCSLRAVDHWRAGTRAIPRVVFRFLRLVELVQSRHPDTWAEFMESESK